MYASKASSSSTVRSCPVGLDGEHTMTSFVCSVVTDNSFSFVSVKLSSSLSSRNTGVAPLRVIIDSYETHAGATIMTSSFGFNNACMQRNKEYFPPGVRMSWEGSIVILFSRCSFSVIACLNSGIIPEAT